MYVLSRLRIRALRRNKGILTPVGLLETILTKNNVDLSVADRERPENKVREGSMLRPCLANHLRCKLGQHQFWCHPPTTPLLRAVMITTFVCRLFFSASEGPKGLC